jgi:hypothetical protein
MHSEGVKTNVVKHRRHNHSAVFLNPSQDGLCPRTVCRKPSLHMRASSRSVQIKLFHAPCHDIKDLFKKDVLTLQSPEDSYSFRNNWTSKSWLVSKADLKFVSKYHPQATVNQSCQNSSWIYMTHWGPCLQNDVSFMCDSPCLSTNHDIM